VLRVESEAFQAANGALGSMKAALPTASETTGAVTSSMETMQDAIPAARSDGMQAPAASGVARMAAKGIRLGPLGGDSMAVTTGTKDSLYTLDDAPAAPTHRVAAPAASTYDRYAVTDSTYSRNPVPAW
jgi:hypothetical protein